MVNKTISTSLAVVLLFTMFLMISATNDANAGGPVNEPGCCQVLSDGEFQCNNTDSFCIVVRDDLFLGFFEGSDCNEMTGLCEGFDPSDIRDVPTLSEWGLIAMAGVLGVIGFMVIRRKRATA